MKMVLKVAGQPEQVIKAQPDVYTITLTEDELKILWHRLNEPDDVFISHYNGRQQAEYIKVGGDERTYQLWADINTIIKEKLQ